MADELSYDEYRANKKITKPIRKLVDLSEYYINEEGELQSDGWEQDPKDIIALFTVYKVEKCICKSEVAEYLMDRKPNVFEDVDLELE